jgi:tetratricopeptide (TPR) repeat protein
MRCNIFIIPILSLLMISSGMADAPTLVDLQGLAKKGDWEGVVKGAGDALAPGGVTDPGDRFKIAMLKGDAHLRLRQADEAVDAFNGAVKETQNDKPLAIAKATVILIGRSKDFIYTSLTIPPPPPQRNSIKTSVNPIPATTPATDPTSGKIVVIPPPAHLPRGQFDIIDPVHRADAMAAMWTDERLDAEKAIKEKISSHALPDINLALDRIHQAEPIAIAAGASEWGQTQRNGLANAARLDATGAMKDMNMSLIEITKSQARRRNNPQPKPMPQEDRDKINQMTEALNQITKALKALPEALKVDKTAFATQLDQAARLQDRATTVLATD